MYEGTFVENELNGYGKETVVFLMNGNEEQEDGTIYEGEWKSNSRNGYGKEVIGKCGRHIQDDWTDNDYGEDWPITSYHCPGRINDGQWKNGRQYGNNWIRLPNGHAYKQLYNEGGYMKDPPSDCSVM
jgi:hypothetical protein